MPDYKQVLVIAGTPEQLNRCSWQIPRHCYMTLVWSEEEAIKILTLRKFDEIVRLM